MAYHITDGEWSCSDVSILSFISGIEPFSLITHAMIACGNPPFEAAARLRQVGWALFALLLSCWFADWVLDCL